MGLCVVAIALAFANASPDSNPLESPDWLRTPLDVRSDQLKCASIRHSGVTYLTMADSRCCRWSRADTCLLFDLQALLSTHFGSAQNPANRLA